LLRPGPSTLLRPGKPDATRMEHWHGVHQSL
jgi:hypothetical protein